MISRTGRPAHEGVSISPSFFVRRDTSAAAKKKTAENVPDRILIASVVFSRALIF